jgi:hypothetical protein
MSEPYETELTEVATPPCVYCNEVKYVTVDIDGLEKYRAGAFIQDAFPRMPADVREMLISGTCPDCWERHIKPLEDEEPEDW